MREVIPLQIGGSGNKISIKYLNLISSEHGLDPDGSYHGASAHQLEGISTYYTERSNGNFFPRSILLDIDQCVIDSIVSGAHSNFYKPDNIITGRGGTGNNWAKGYYSGGYELLEEAVDVIRKEIEGCECFQGFEIAHSIGGGTGGGMEALLLEKMEEEYNDKMIQDYSIIPSPNYSVNILEPINSILSLNKMINLSNYLAYVIHNESLYNIFTNQLKIPRPSYDDINSLISSFMSGVSCGIRFPGEQTTNIRKLATNLVPFQPSHFLITSYAPVTPKENLEYQKITVKDLTRQIFDMSNMMVKSGRSGRYYSAVTIFRGNCSIEEIDKELINYKNKNKDLVYFLESLPCNLLTFSCDVPPIGVNQAASFIVNSSVMEGVLKDISDKYQVMKERKAFLHLYTEEGMDEFEFEEAFANVNDLIVSFFPMGGE